MNSSRKSFKRKVIADFPLTRKYTKQEIERILSQFEEKTLEAKAYNFYAIYTYEGILKKDARGKYVINDKDAPLNLSAYLTGETLKLNFNRIRIKLIKRIY